MGGSKVSSSVSLRVAKLYDFPKMKLSMLLHFIFALGIVSSSSTVCASCECEELLHPVSNYTVAMPSSKSPALRARAKKSSKRASKSKPNTKKSDQKPSKAAAKPKVEVGKGPKQNVELPIHLPDPVPLCTTCQQRYGDNETELLPNNVPLKWRSFWTKTIEV